MAIKDRNIAADAAIDPAKIGWGVKSRQWMCDFDGADGDAVASTFLGFQTLDVGGTSYSTCLVGQKGATDAQRNSVAIFTLGNGSDAEQSFAGLYGSTLWSSTGRTLTARCRITDATKLGDGTGLSFGFGLAIGSSFSDYQDQCVMLLFPGSGANNGKWQLDASLLGGSAANVGVGFDATVATDLEITVNGLTYTAKINGVLVGSGVLETDSGLSTDAWLPILYAERTDGAATDAVDICVDYLEVVQGR